MTDTVSAAGINFVDISGNHVLTYDAQDQGYPGSVNGTNLLVRASIQRFLADGTTPDPFPTPEPSGLGVVAGLSGVVLLSWKFRGSKRHSL